MKDLTIKNVILAVDTVSATYPFWSDYGYITKFKKVITKEEDGYKTEFYQTEDVREWDEGYNLTLEFLDENEINEYHKILKEQRIRTSKGASNSLDAKVGDTIEVVKGRKHPIGKQFVVRSEYLFKDKYGRIQGHYWVDGFGNRIDKFNSIIVA